MKLLKALLRSLVRRCAITVIARCTHASRNALVPGRMRQKLLYRYGLRNSGAAIPRNVVFANPWVTLEAGTRILPGCRFEGGAPITVLSGTTLGGPILITTRSEDPRHIRAPRIDIPLVVSSSLIVSERSTISPSATRGVAR
jgi:hypothetical protein